MVEPGTPVVVRFFPAIVDLVLAASTLVLVVAIALATGVNSPWDGAIQLGLFLGVLLFFRRRWPMVVLLLSIAAVFVYHFAAGSPAGWIWPASVAYFTAAAGPRVRWVIAIGVAQLVYSAIEAGWIINSNLSRYLIHTIGEGLLLCALIAVGLAYAASLRWHRRPSPS